MNNLKTQIHKEFDDKLDKIMLPKNDLELHDKIQTLMWELIDEAIAEERKRIVEMIKEATGEMRTSETDKIINLIQNK